MPGEELITSGERTAVIVAFVFYLMVLIGIGLYSRRILGRTAIDKFAEEFYTAGRGLGAFVVAFMIAAGLCSVGTFVGGPGLSWSIGMPWVALIGLQIFMNFTILTGIGKKFAIVARRVNALSVGDILFERADKDKRVALIYGIVTLVFLVAYCAAQFLGASRIFEVMTGFSFYYALIFAGIVTILYSTLGGIRGVGLGALIQGIVMTVAVVFLVGAVFSNVIKDYGSLLGATKAMAQIAGEKHISLYMPMRWEASMWFLFNWGLVALPHGLLAAMNYKSTKAAKRAIMLGAVIVTFWTFGMLWSGFLAKLYFPKLPVPDHAVPSLTLKFLPPWAAGIIFAGVIAAAQSTIAAMTMIMGSAITQNIYRQVMNPQATPEQMKRVSQYATLGVGLLAFIFALVQLPALEWIVIFAIGGSASALFWPIILGLFWKKGGKNSMVASMITGLIIYIIAKRIYTPLAFGMDAIVVGVVSSLIVYMGVALITKEEPSERVIKIFWGAEPPSG